MRCENNHVFCSNCQRYESGWIGDGKLMCPKCDTESYDYIGDIGEEENYSDYSSSSSDSSDSSSGSDEWLGQATLYLAIIGGVVGGYFGVVWGWDVGGVGGVLLLGPICCIAGAIGLPMAVYAGAYIGFWAVLILLGLLLLSLIIHGCSFLWGLGK
jgi:hypothetical protein